MDEGTNKDYTITWLLCAFSLVVDRDLLKDTIVFLFSCPKNPSINHLNFYCIKQIDNIFPCVYCNRSQKTSQRVKNNSHATRLRLVSYFLVLYTLWRPLWSIAVHTRKNVTYLLNIYQQKRNGAKENAWWGKLQKCFLLNNAMMQSCIHI